MTTIQPLIFWPANIARPATTSVAYASIPQPGNRYGIGPDESIPTLNASLPNLTVTMPNGASLVVQRINLEGPEKVNEVIARRGDWEAYIEGDFGRWAYISQSLSDTLDSYLEPDEQDHAAVTPMDEVRQAWPDGVPAPEDVQIDFNKTRTTVTAFLPSGATMTFTRFHDAGYPQGHYDQISHSGDWSSIRNGMPQVREALEKGLVAHRAGMVGAAAA